MKVKSCWDDQETHAACPAWAVAGGVSEPMTGFGEASDLPGQTDHAAPAGEAGRAAQAGAAPTSMGGLRRRASDSLFQSLMRLWPRDGRRPEASVQTMARLRSAFRGCLADLMQEARVGGDVRSQLRLEALFGHIVHSTHPEDLWHLRASVYTEVARARSQTEAERRVALLTLQFDLSRGRLKLWNGRG